MQYSIQHATHSTFSIDMSDQSLLQQAIDGEQEAFTAIVQRYTAPLLRFIRRSLNPYSDDLADDVLQHVWLQFYRCLPKLSAEHPIKPWLFRVASNRCIDEIRHRQHHHVLLFSALEQEVNEDELSLLAEIEDVYPLPEEVVEQQERRHVIELALTSLPPKFRAVVILRAFQHMSFGEIAQRLKMPSGTVKTYFHRAKPLLRAALQAS